MNVRKIILVLAMSALLICPAFGQDRRATIEETYKGLGPLMEALDLVKKGYVSEDKVAGNELLYGAVRGMLETLDPYSQFMTPKDLKGLQDDTQGHFGGIGVVISIRNDFLTVISAIEGTPAAEAGILADDRIVKIDGESTRGITIDGAVNKLRGDPGTKVTVTISRPGFKDLMDKALTRTIIEVPDTVWSHLFRGNIGYIRLKNFNSKSNEEIVKALSDLEAQGMKAIVFDLRNNPGGLLMKAWEVASTFLPKGKLIVYTEGRLPESVAKYYSMKDPFHPEMPLVVLGNGGSASASEIVIGALKDNRRGLFVGTKTFGKASVQSVYAFSDGSGMRLTTAHYFTPGGHLIHEKGIEPDILVDEDRPVDYELLTKLSYQEYYVVFARKYVEQHPDLKYRELKVDDQLLGEFVKYVRTEGFAISDDQVRYNEKWLRQQGRIYLVKQAEGEKAAQVVALEEDSQFQRAADIVQAMLLNK